MKRARTILNRLQRLMLDMALSGAAFFVVTVLPLVHSGQHAAPLMEPLITYTLASLPALYAMRTYRTIWRYTSFRDLARLAAAAVLTMIVFLTVEFAMMNPGLSVPGTLLAWTIVLVSIANIGFLAAPRFVIRALDEGFSMRHLGRSGAQARAVENVLLTGDAGRMEAFIRECAREHLAHYRVVAVLTDDVRLHGSYLQGVPVRGKAENLPAIIADFAKQRIRLDMLVVATNDTVYANFGRLLELATVADLKVGRLPPLGMMSEGTPVRPVEISDLLGRPEIKIDMQAVASMITGKCVLVTGGGGSIGGELCRQVARLKPSRLVVLDNGEFNLYAIDAELADKYPDVVRETALVDVRDPTLVSHWIGRSRPSIVFHAAALKHVPLIEDHPIEGIKTNVVGTINVAEACRAHRVPAMVMISTDKAVNPTNVMGATKRLAEAYCQGLDLAGDAAAITRFIMVRFGNVLGSAGSVVPLFRRQIETGGPVTVTHPDITRYFMTIPEAVTLVLMAGAQGMEEAEDRGHIYLLDMGQPIKIVELAREMIRLSGQRPDKDIKIEFIGLRPGEKLFEELSYTEEKVQPTRSKSIFKLDPRATDLRIMRQQVLELRQACANEDRERALRLLKISVPDYCAEMDRSNSSQS